MSKAVAVIAPDQWSRTALTLPEQTTFDEWLAVGDKLRSMERSVQWWIGDWLLFGETSFANRFAAAAEATGYSLERLKDARRVSAAFPAEDRSEQVEWSVHRIAASLPRERRIEVIREAEANNWTCREAKAEVARLNVGLTRGDGHQPIPMPNPAEQSMRRTSRIVQAAFVDWFGIGDEYARVVLCLYQASGEKRDWREIAKFVSTHAPMSRGAVHEAISTIREVFDCEAIDRDDAGYWLTEIGQGECRRAFRELGKQLMGMGAEPANEP